MRECMMLTTGNCYLPKLMYGNGNSLALVYNDDK